MDIYAQIQQNRKLFEEVIRYFLSESYFEKSTFEEAKRIARNNVEITHSKGQEALINLGYFSALDFILFVNEKKIFTAGIQLAIVENFIKRMNECNLVIAAPTFGTGILNLRYKSNTELAKFLIERDAVTNTLGGWQYIANKFKDSVFKIIHKNSDGDHSIGTGFYYACGGKINNIAVIVTNKHVVENAVSIQIIDENEMEIPHTKIIMDSNRDLAYLILTQLLDRPVIHLVLEKEILKEVLTIGYPSIPMTKHAYQVCHKGEINSYVENYFNAKLFLISAKTSSGNSGSPIIDEHGFAVGIVSEEFFEEEAFKKKGKLPYSAGIPSEEIINSLNQYIVPEIPQLQS